MQPLNVLKLLLLSQLLLLLPISLTLQDELFKISKLNLVWTKAQHSLGPSKLKDLKKDLTKQEFDEMTLKKMKAHNQDKDGLFEAATRKKLLSIMTKYSLERYYDDIHPPAGESKGQKVVDKSEPSMKDLKPTFRDKKLDKLWKKAEQSSFTQEQLMILHEEFQHQQDKLDEHYEMLNSIDQQLDERMKVSENSIESNIENETKGGSKRGGKSGSKKGESPSDKKARLDSNMHQALREKYSEIKKNIDQLQKKIASGKVDAKEGPFEEAPVNDLWSAAVQSNFTSKELESFKEELEHYQTRIKKLKHFEAQLERNRIGTKDSLSYGEEVDDETKHIMKRVKELGYKVEKTHHTLERRIMNKREEL